MDLRRCWISLSLISIIAGRLYAADTTPPNNVTNFHASPRNESVKLSWTNPSDTDWNGTIVVRKTGGYPTHVNDGTQVCNLLWNDSTNNRFTDTGLTNGTTYYYTAFAYDEVPNYSSAVSSAQGNAAPQVVHSGTLISNETWSGDSVLVVGDVTVSSGVTLTIEPGTTVRFTADNDDETGGENSSICELIIEGTLVAEGTSDSMITFNSDSSSPEGYEWYGIIFKPSSADTTCSIKYADFKYAYYAITCDDASPTISDNTFSNSWYGDIQCIDSSSPTISNNTFTGRYTGINGLICSSSSPLISYNTFNGNEIVIMYTSNCTISNNTFTNARVRTLNGDNASITISDNTFSGGGIYVDVSSPAFEGKKITLLTITGNTISGGSGDGIHIQEDVASFICNNNTISNNSDDGIDFYDATVSSAIISNCTITGNSGKGILILANGEYNLGNLNNADTSDDGNNEIYNNGQYDVYNWTSSTIMAENNWWGETDATEIDSHIYDDDENTSKGVVDFQPFLTSSPIDRTPPSAVTNFVATADSQQISLTWTNPPDPDYAGTKIIRKTTGYPASVSDGTLIYNGTGTSYTDTGLTNGTTYYYTAFAYDEVPNYSSAVASARDSATPQLAYPTSLSASAVSTSQINLSWADNSLRETGFEIERKTGSGGTYNQIATVNADITSYSDTILSEATTYYYRVRAYNAESNSSYSNEASATTLPAGPSGLTASTISGSQINLSWTDNSSGETGFKIERKTGADGTYSEFATVSSNVTTYSDTGLGELATFYYRVKAYNISGNSSYSNEASAITLLAEPSNLITRVVSISEIILLWTDNSLQETGFEIERKTGSGGTYNQIATVSADVATYTDTGLNEAVTYYYKIRAYRASEYSVYSNETIATTLPNAPSSLNAAPVSDNKITLTWQDNSGGESGFKIERKKGTSGSYSQIATVASNVTSYNDTSPDEATTYYYRVCAYTSEYSPYSNETSALTFPAAPSGLSLTSSTDGEVTLTWQDNSSGETGFKIERKVGETGTYSEIKTVSSNTTSYKDTYSADADNYYRVAAYNSSGNSGYSNEANFLTLPEFPFYLTAEASGNGVNLTWTDRSIAETGFIIERRESPYSLHGYIVIATVDANLTSYTDTGLSAGETYYYRVMAYNTLGNSEYSEEVAVTTSASGSGGVGGCFIATAAYGTPMTSEVVALSRFRDTRLLTNPIGKRLVSFYYKVSPPIADFIAKHESLKSMVRFFLKPVIKLVE